MEFRMFWVQDYIQLYYNNLDLKRLRRRVIERAYAMMRWVLFFLLKALVGDFGSEGLKEVHRPSMIDGMTTMTTIVVRGPGDSGKKFEKD